jgi:cell wall-associated NlpC family hydrolase
MHFVGVNPAARVPISALVDAARSFVGVPFLHQGRTRHGLDCIGLVIAALTKVGVVFYEEPPTYARLPHGDTLLDPLRQYCVPADAAEPGLLLAIRFRREVTHVALLTGPSIIHAYEGARRAVEHSYDPRWQKLTAGQWRLPGIEYAGTPCG